MMAVEILEHRRAAIAESRDLSALLERLAERARPVLDHMPFLPAAKALLSTDGGVCPRDGTALDFDPWSPETHRCAKCGAFYTGERHDRAWARFQHLWIAEQTAQLAAVAVLADRADAAERAESLLAHYGRHYLEYPNSDNVLGPARLFFSTYLESVWLCNYLAAAMLLRDAGMLSEETISGVSAVADEAANLIGEFDEGFSNRQTWHNAALAAIAVWFEDEELSRGVIERETGMIAHLVHGFGADGMWYEGENYHLFALRGQLVGMSWARLAGADLLADPRLAAALQAAVSAPAKTALPDFTFPARKDSRFGVSLAQPMYLESWEIGLAWLGHADAPLWSWLRDLYASPAPEAQRFDSYLYEAGVAPSPQRRTRADLSWWALLEMAPALPDRAPAWTPGSALLQGQGLAILRSGSRYASLESGVYGGGHGHPDRLHLTLHADGVHWLPDFGTGSYVARDLFWYRSTLAHNAPLLDGVSQSPGDAVPEYFAESGDWAWTRGRFGGLTRTLVAGPRYLLDIVESSAAEEHTLELPWHFGGRSDVLTAGTWVPDALSSEFVRDAERLVPGESSDGEYVILAVAEHASGSPVTLIARMRAGTDLVRAKAPGAPGSSELATFYVSRARGLNHRFVSVLAVDSSEPAIRAFRATGDVVEIETLDGVHRHAPSLDGWEITTPSGQVKLGGRQETGKPLIAPLFREQRQPAVGTAALVAERPALDGTLEGFADSVPITLDYEDQYRRSEEPYPGPEEFSATAHLSWDDEMLYVGIDVVKPATIFRFPDVPPLRLDNEPDDIHGDGLQVYVRPTKESAVYGFVIAPADEQGAIQARGIVGTDGTSEMVRGAWQRTDVGYCVTIGLVIPDWSLARRGDRVGFDLLVNRMEPDRLRRVGQLVWSGGGGWVWLRGDRQDPARFGLLVLE